MSTAPGVRQRRGGQHGQRYENPAVRADRPAEGSWSRCVLPEQPFPAAHRACRARFALQCRRSACAARRPAAPGDGPRDRRPGDTEAAPGHPVPVVSTLPGLLQPVVASPSCGARRTPPHRRATPPAPPPAPPARPRAAPDGGAVLRTEPRREHSYGPRWPDARKGRTVLGTCAASSAVAPGRTGGRVPVSPDSGNRPSPCTSVTSAPVLRSRASASYGRRRIDVSTRDSAPSSAIRCPMAAIDGFPRHPKVTHVHLPTRGYRR
ncbi:hypothetical protein SGLAM104S_00881 [Streptomyces glaucescens]